MSATTSFDFKNWLRSHPNPKMRSLFVTLKRVRAAGLPTPGIYNKGMYWLVTLTRNMIETLSRLFIYTPAFKGRLAKCGHSLYLYSGLPLITGPMRIELGNDCRVSGHTTFSARTTPHPDPCVTPTLSVGSNVDIGWQVTIAVSERVEIHDNVRIAGRCQLFGYSGHPLNAKQRAAGDPDEPHRLGSIVLEKDVWLATGVTVQTGVTIGQGTIVAAGSVVTHDLPANVIAAGSPAKVVRHIDQTQ
ncbi:acyltransferase [Vibrio hangzhouensis]|uniref:Transferase hexapeptide (Six repeat-containing protein) n=1 Tax=Vibrio hangzhouensis TaxID=462991 RepID=A0A1H5YZN0_9VIBR|nr:acyltransferase [Vibrio hangzhouensis]SEG29478.1 transferase hexapeptide (six repeat-containing protein) [Vibrio hangzhouensis]